MPRTKLQYELIRNERKDIILTAALYIFSAKGYSRASMDEISKTVGCSHGLLFHYYSSKKDLYVSLINEVAMPLIKKTYESINFDQSAKGIMTDFCKATAKALKSNNDQLSWALNLLLNIDDFVGSKSNATNVLKNYHQSFIHSLSAIIDKGKTEGDFNKEKDTYQTVVAFMALIKGLSYTRMQLGYKKFINPDVNIIMGLFY